MPTGYSLSYTGAKRTRAEVVYMLRTIDIIVLLLALFRVGDHAFATDQLAVSSYGAQIEIGGIVAGLEFHKGYPLPSRISFYYPVANSVDLSSDYWKRYRSRLLALQIFSENNILKLNSLRFKATYTPFSASFTHSDVSISCTLGHSFILMIRALQDYVFIIQILGKAGNKETKLLQLAETMRFKFKQHLWNEDKAYLLNRLDGNEIDYHFYSGSLLAVYYDAIDQKRTLLHSAEQHFLDLRLGMRNAMPADFHHLIERYGFNGNEAGAPWLYFNGAVWPQGNAWYILGLIADNRIDWAHQALVDYMTLKGIENSPNGQPSFYEYRNRNPLSDDYGKVDKPAFLWAAGWFLKSLYHLIGVCKNPWNLSFAPVLPQLLDDIEYDLYLNGRQTRIYYRNSGPFFKDIKFDGRQAFSAVLFGSPDRIELTRGMPARPCLAEASCRIGSLFFKNDILTVSLLGTPEQRCRLTFVSPQPLQILRQTGLSTAEITTAAENTLRLFAVNVQFAQTEADLKLVFSHVERKSK